MPYGPPSHPWPGLFMARASLTEGVSLHTHTDTHTHTHAHTHTPTHTHTHGRRKLHGGYTMAVVNLTAVAV